MIFSNDAEGTGGRVAANLQSAQQSLKFQTTVATVDHKLEKRPSQQDLMDHNIIKGLSSLSLTEKMLLTIILIVQTKMAPSPDHKPN